MKGRSSDYLQAVEAHFVALRGKGYALSGRDVGRVLAWQAEGVPLRVVLQALDEEATRRGPGLAHAARPVTLGSFARTVREGAARWAERHPTLEGAPTAAEVDRFACLREALGGLEGRADIGVVVRQASRRLSELESAGVDAWSAARALDELIAEELHRTLDAEVRAEVAREVESRLDPRASPQANAEKADFERARAVRERLGVPELLPVMLDAR